MRDKLKQIDMRLVGISYFSLFCLALIENAKSPIYPKILEFFNISYAEGSWLFIVGSLPGIIITGLTHLWLPKLKISGGKKVFSLLLLLSAILFSLSINNFPYYPLLLLSCALTGAAMGGLNITMNLGIQEGAPGELRRQAFNGLHSLYGLASFIAPAILVLIVKFGLPWNQLLNFLLFLPLALVIIVFRTPAEKLNYILKENEETETGIPASIKKVLPVAILFSLYVTAEVTISSRFRVFVDYLYPNLENGRSAELLTLFFALLTLGRVILIFVRLPFSNNIILGTSLLSSISLMLAGVYIHPMFLALTGLSMSVYFPCAMDLVAVYFGHQMTKALPIVMNVISIHLLVTHYIVGQLNNLVGPYGTMSLPITHLVLAFIILIFISRSPRE